MYIFTHTYMQHLHTHTCRNTTMSAEHSGTDKHPPTGVHIFTNTRTHTRIVKVLIYGSSRFTTLVHLHSTHLQHTYTYANAHTYIRKYTHTCTHAYMHIYIHIYIYTYRYTYIHPCIRTWIHTYTNTHTHTHIYIYIYIYIYIRYKIKVNDIKSIYI